MLKLRSSFLLILLFITFSSAFAKQNDKCIINRTIFEIGSGSIKAKKAKIDICENIIVKVLAQTSKVLPLQEQIEKSQDKATLPQNTIDSLIKNINLLAKNLSVNCKESQCVAIGTAALREAKNSQEVINILKKQVNMQLFVISQEEEGDIGYLSALANIPDKSVTAKNLMVLDIGGGSSQLIYNTKHLTKTVNAKMGSQNFKAMVIQYVKDYHLTEVNTPNPLTKEEIQKTKRLADKVIGSLFLSSPGVRHVLKNNKELRIVGIGNLLNKMIPNILNKKEMTLIKLSDIDNEINKLIFESDYFIKTNYKDVNPSYISEVVTDLILVYSIMKNLQLDEMKIMDIDNNDGILISNEYWN